MTGLIVYIAGVEWDAVPGTDRKLASALSAQSEVLWVDPPISPVRYIRLLRQRHRWDIGLDSVSPSITRLRVLAAPGTSRPLLRDLISLHLSRRITVAVSKRSPRPEIRVIVNASPEAAFPPGLPGRRLFYITDDWIDGAHMIGMDSRRVRDRMLRNAREADVTAAVTPGLAETIDRSSHEVALLPNGCTVDDARSAATRPSDLPKGPLVGLVGQINERIDLRAVRAVADSGAKVVVIGPRTERAELTSEAIDQLFAHPNIYWLGQKAARELPEYLAEMTVGITPYCDTAFNQRSFPLKTLEYLAAGLPVVSSDLPAVGLLDCVHIRVADNPHEFARLVMEQLTRDTSIAPQCIDFARKHTWDVRAGRLIQLLDENCPATQTEKDARCVL